MASDSDSYKLNSNDLIYLKKLTSNEKTTNSHYGNEDSLIIPSKMIEKQEKVLFICDWIIEIEKKKLK